VRFAPPAQFVAEAVVRASETSDIGWIVAHSVMVYGPWCNGTTVVVREGAPDHPHPGLVWETIERYGVSKTFTAPTALRMFTRMDAKWPAALGEAAEEAIGEDQCAACRRLRGSGSTPAT
jgi:acyl-coenzyme A synthetase/AMP-(fatty) acid ligase